MNSSFSIRLSFKFEEMEAKQVHVLPTPEEQEATEPGEITPEALYQAVTRGLTKAYQAGAVGGIGSMKVCLDKNHTVTSYMSQNGSDGLPDGQTAIVQVSHTAKIVSRPSLDPEASEDSRLNMAAFIMNELPGSTIHPPYHNDQDSFGVIVCPNVKGSFVLSFWREHSAGAACERKRLEKLDAKEKLEAEQERARQKKLADKAKQRERDRLKYAEQRVADERRRQEQQATTDAAASAAAEAVRRQTDLEARIAALELKELERKAEKAEETRLKVIAAEAKQALREATREAGCAKFSGKRGYSPPSGAQ